MSLFWFEKLKDITPNHLITADVDQMPPDVKAYAEVLRGRAMLVRKAQILPLEAIVRGYITGTLFRLGWRVTQNETNGNFWFGTCRIGLDRVQEERNNARNKDARGTGRVPEAPRASIHAIDESRTGGT